MPQQIKSEILDNRRSGEYHVLSLTAPGISDIAKPGHFVTLAMGGEESSMVLRPGAIPRGVRRHLGHRGRRTGAGDQVAV